jgi:hypothetical protein
MRKFKEIKAKWICSAIDIPTMKTEVIRYFNNHNLDIRKNALNNYIIIDTKAQITLIGYIIKFENNEYILYKWER